jgi:hypothetical protein
MTSAKVGRLRDLKVPTRRICVVAALLACVLNISSCDSDEFTDEERVFREALVQAVKYEKPAFQLGKITPFAWNRVCVLTAYEMHLPSNHPEAVVVNRALSEIKYKGDEHRWALAFVDKGAVKLLRVKRGIWLDLLGVETSDVKRLENKNAVTEYQVVRCSTHERAYVVSGKSEATTYVYLAEKKE